MGEMIRTLLLLLYGSFIVAGQSASIQCSNYCSASNILNLEQGKTYEYLYSGWAETSLNPHSPRPEDHDAASGLLLNATVVIKTVSPCEISLEMKDAQLSGESRGSIYADLLTKEPIRASLQAGRVETVCAAPTNSAAERWALNVKKAVLSAFQLPLKSLDSSDVVTLHETDISGVCRTNYECMNMQNSTLVVRTKDLTQCSGRHDNIDLELPKMGFRTSSTPLLKGSQYCIQSIVDGKMVFSECKETHVFQPFSANNGSSGVTTTVHQTLTLENVTREESFFEPLPTVFFRSSLLFEHGDRGEIPKSEHKQEEVLDEAKEVLQELTGESGRFSVRAESAKLFGNLVRAMENLDELHLKSFVTDLEASDVERTFIMDALPTLDTSAGIFLMSNLYMEREKQIPKIKVWLEKNAATWFASLANSRRIDSASIKQLQKLLVYSLMGYASEADVPSIVLGITGLARTYCDETGGLATCSYTIYEIITTLEQVLKPEFHANEKTLIVAMKGLGNIGVFVNGNDALKNTILNETANIEIRLAALDAFRRTPCSSLDVPAFLNIFSDTAQDTEIRIGAYLVTVKCPSSGILRVVKRALYSETVNQVGSFVWTHLTNSQESTGKSRQVLRALLANEYLQNKFNTDARQFSRNFEGSHYFESLKLGTNFDANVIFSPKSYLPRSAMLNLTVDLFGESLNLLEVGGRAEGFESMVEQLFSKKGAFENEAIENFLKNARKDEQYESIRNITTPMKKTSKPKASAFVRFNGLEISYLELENVLQNAYRFNIHPRDLIRNLISRKEFEFTRSLELINVEKEFPTLIGLPLKLALNGTASVKVGLRGHFEKTFSGVEVFGYFAPSASVALLGTISMGQSDFEQGVKFAATLFTHTTLDSQLSITKDGKLNFQSHMPDDKQTIVDLKTERIIFNGNQVHKIPDLAEQRENSSFCTGEWVDSLLGLKFCSDMSYPNASLFKGVPSFPLNGDLHFTLTVEKTDPTFSAYEFSTSWTHIPGQKYDYSIFFDRVGSEMTNKKRAIALVYDKEAGVAVASLDLPEKQAGISILWDSKDFSAAEFVLSYDRVNYAEILAKLNHQKTIIANTKEQFGKIEPEVKFKVRTLPEFHLKGIINYSGKSKLTVQLNLSGLTKLPILLAADYYTDMSSGAINARVSVDSQFITWDVKANAKITPSSLGLRINGVYNVTAELQHSLEIMTKYNWNQQGALRRMFLNLKTQLSQWPQYSGQLQADVMLSKGFYEGNLRVALTDEEWNITQRFQSSGIADVWIKQTINCDKRDMKFLLEHRHKYVPDSFSTTTQLNVDAKRHTNFHLDYKYIQGDGISFAAESQLIWPRFTFSTGAGPNLQSRVRQVFPGEFEAFLITQWSETRKPVKINATYKDKSTQQKLSHSLDSTLMGAFGFEEENVLGVTGNFGAVSNIANIDGMISVGGSQKCAIDLQYEVDKLGEKSFFTKISHWQTPEQKKDYEIQGTYYKSSIETSASFDLKMSRHLSFSFKTSSDDDQASFFWDKARDTSKNVTIRVEYPKANEIAANLLMPGQNITVSGHMRYISAASKNDDAIHLSGHAVGGKITWFPEREISVLTNYKGNLNSGLEIIAEIGTRSFPVIGTQLRVFEGEYIPQKVNEGGKVVFKHAWQNKENKLENFVAQIFIDKSNNQHLLEFSLLSSLWGPKIVTGSFKNMFKNWNHFNGNVSGYCGQDGLSFAWDWNIRNGAKLEIDSTWKKIASTKFEIKYNVSNKSKPGVMRNWIIFENDNDVWKAGLNLKKEKSTGGGDFVMELTAETPLADFENHEIAAALKWNKYDINCTGQISTPLVGDYSFIFSNKENTTSDYMHGKLTILNADTIVADLNVIGASLSTSPGLTMEIDFDLPEILNVKSEVKIEINENGGEGKINFNNNNKLLHDFRLGYHHEQEDEAVKFEVDFSGYSYLVMPSRWKLKVKHEGSKMNHTSFLEVNKFTLDHKFEHFGEENWKLALKGVADQKEVLKIEMNHKGFMDCTHNLHMMSTEVVDIVSKGEFGYVNLNFMNKIVQIHTRVVDDDEFKTTTKITFNHKLYATVLTSTFLRYKDNDGGLESAIISLNVDADRNSAKVQVNVDAWRQVTGSVQVKYSVLKLDVNLDVLSPNNSLFIAFENNGNKILKLDTFVFYGPPTAEVGVTLHCKSYSLKIEGEGTMDEDMIVFATVKVDDNKNIEIFPMTIVGKWQLPKEENSINTGGKITFKTHQQAEVQLTGNTKYEEFYKNINITLAFVTQEREDKYGVYGNYENQDKQYLFANYKHNDEKFEVEFMLTEMLLEAKLETPLEEYKYLSLKAGVAELSEREKRFLEFIKNDYRLDAELYFTKFFSKSQMIGIAKSNNGFEVEAVVDKIETETSTDVAFAVQLNDFNKIEAGAYLEYGIGNLNITANITRDGKTSRMRSVIYNTAQVKSFAIKSEYQHKTYELEIYSSIENELAYEQGFKIETQGLKSEFRYEKSDSISIAYLKYQEQKLQCELKGNSRVGALSVYHTNEKIISEIKLTYDFDGKIDTSLLAFLNQQYVEYRDNVKYDLPLYPLQIKAKLNPQEGQLHFSLLHRDIEYLFEGSFIDEDTKKSINAAIITPYFKKICLNASYDFENSMKTIEIRFDYGTDFYEIVSEVLVDGSYSFNLNLDAKSSVPDYEKIAVKGGFRNNKNFSGQLQMDFPSDTYILTVESVPEKSCGLKLETRDNTYVINYSKQEGNTNFVEFFRDDKQMFNATFQLANETLQTTIMTPHDKYQNLTLYVGYGSNLPSKNLVIHRNNDIVFKAHMYPMDHEELNSGTGIMATIYQGDQKFVYDAQFSIDNPVFIILKQHDTGNVTRDILHFSLNVTDESTASGRAEILLPLSPNTKLLARGHIQIENKNAEFKMSYKFDEEEENNFAIHYTTYTDNYNIYNIVTNMTTPFKGYENMTLKITSSWTETVVKFTSQFPSYENIALVAVHRLEGPQKELWVQYQNMQKSIFYVKALFLNEPANKKIELKTRTPFLNGEALASNNGSVMEVMLEHESVTLCQIISKFEDVVNGKKYEFTFKKPDRVFHLESKFVRNLDTDFSFIADLDEKQVAKIDFRVSPLGKIDSVISLVNDVQYQMTGQINWLGKSLQLTITNAQSFVAKIEFELQQLGFLKITSSEMQHDIAVEWEFSDQITSFNITREQILSINFEASNTHVSFKMEKGGSIYSFIFGQMKNNGWPNVYLAIIWDNETLIDFLHDFLTDAHLLIVKTRLTSPYLGSHKNMKFSLTLKTRDLIQMEAEFKWRPKDLTTFSATLQMDRLVSSATVLFISPFTSNFSFNAQYDFSVTEKTFDIVYVLGNTVSLQGRIIPSGIDQSLFVKLVTPIIGYTTVELTGFHKIIGKTHRAELHFTRENERKSVELYTDDSNLKAVINTPESRWSLNANYLFSHETYNIDGAFQWGGASDVVQFEAQYKPGAKLYIDLNGPKDMKYALDYKMLWTNEKKSVEFLLQKNKIVTEFSGSLSTKENLHVLVAFIKSPLFHFVKISALMDAGSSELGGALQVNEEVFSMKATKVVDNSYKIILAEDGEDIIELDIAFEGEYEKGLKVFVECKTPDYKFGTQGSITFREDILQISTTVSWGEQGESVFFAYKKEVTTEIECKLNTLQVADSEIFIAYGQNFVTAMLRNQSDTYKGSASYLVTDVYSINGTVEINGANYEVQTYYDPGEIQIHALYIWPRERKIDMKVVLKPGDITLTLKTPYVQFTNIQVNGKYSEMMTYNDYQLASKADAKWNDYLISLAGVIKSSQNNYGLNGKLVWDNNNEINLNFGVIDSRILDFELKTPFKGLPHFSAQLEALKYRHIVSGIRGTLKTPFEKLPVLNFTFNRADDLIEIQFAFDTPTYKNISIHTKLKNKNNNYLYMKINTPFVSKVKHFVVDARSNKILNKNGLDTKISVQLDDSLYEINNNYTVINGKLDSYVFMRGPSNRLNPINVRFGGKFEMKSLRELDVEAFLNDALIGCKYNLSKDIQLSGRIYLAPIIKLPKTEVTLNIVRSNHFEGKIDYLYGAYTGNALVKNKLKDNSLETIMYLSLPQILKYPLQVELNANYQQPRLQFNGFASYMAEHRLELIMVQTSFRTTLNAQLNSAFFKGTNKFDLTLSSGALSVSMNDELKITGLKKDNQLVLTLSQVSTGQDHTITYNWDLSKPPTFEVTLDSPILSAKRATFSATYLGPLKGVNIKLVSGSESLRLDYDVINKNNSKGLKIVVGNTQAQILNFSAYLDKIANGHEVIAEMTVLEINYKTSFRYSLPMQKSHPNLDANLFLSLPYLFPIKLLSISLQTGKQSDSYLIASNISLDSNNVEVKGKMSHESLNLDINTSFEEIASILLEADYKQDDEQRTINSKLSINGDETLRANVSMLKLPNGVLFQVESKSIIKHFEEMNLKLTIPSELRYSLTANFELRGTTHFDAQLMLSSRTGYTNLELKLTGLAVNMYLTSNQGFFSYKTKYDDYSMKIYSKSSGHQLESEVTVNSGQTQLFKAGLFGMYHNHSEFYILMSTNCVYESMPDVVLYMGAKKSEIKFGTEFDYKQGGKDSYSVIINHFIESATDFDIGLTLESSIAETFTAKLTHVLKEDFYIALAQVNTDIIKITKIEQNSATLVTGTLKCGEFGSEISGKLANELNSKGVDLKLTWNKQLYQVGGSYNYSEEEYINVKFNLNSPQTGMYSGAFEFSKPTNLYVLFDRDQSPLLLIELNAEKVRSKYVLFNATNTKFMLSEFYNNHSYEIMASALYDSKTFEFQYDSDSFPESPDSFRSNTTISFPTRTVGLSLEKYISDSHNVSQCYVSWENLDRKIGYLVDITKDNFKTNLKASIEIPNRAIDFKTHYKLMEIPEEVTDFEFGVQFNWNSKIRQNPITFITTVKLDHEQKIAYHYSVLAHPSFNSSYVIDGVMNKPNPYDNFFTVKMGPVDNGKMTPALTLKVNMTRKSASSQYHLTIEHPRSNLHQRWEVQINYENGLGATVSLLQGHTRGYSSVAFSYNNLQSKIELGLIHNELTAELIGQLIIDRQNKRYGFYSSGSFDMLMPPITLTAIFEKPEMSHWLLNAELNLAPERAYAAEAKFTPYHISTILATHEYGKVKPALQAALTLNTTDTISFVGKYQAAVWRNLTKDLQDPIEKAKVVTLQIVDGLRTILREEILFAGIVKSITINSAYRKIMEHTTLEWNSVRQDIASLKQLIKQIYEKDTFFMRTIWNYTIRIFTHGYPNVNNSLYAVYEALQNLVTKTVPSLFTSIYNCTIEPLVSAFLKFSPTLTKFIRKITSTWNEIRNGLSSAFRTTMSYTKEGAARISKHTTANLESIANWSQETKEWLTNYYIEPGRRSLIEMANALETFFNEINAFFVALPSEIESYCLSLEEVQEGIKIYKRYSAWFEEFRFAHYINLVQAELNRWYKIMLEDLHDCVGEYAQIVPKIINAMKGSYDEIMAMPSVVYLRIIYQKVQAKVYYVWEFWKMEQMMQELLIRISDEIILLAQKVSETTDDYRESILITNEEWSFKYDPLNGEISGSLSLPLNWKRFDQMPVLAEDVNEKFHNFRYSLMDKVYELAAVGEGSWKDAVWRTLMPPFRSNSLITINGHVITFDGNHYKVKNVLCGSYLFAADYVDHTFALVASYGNENSKLAGQLTSMTLYTRTGNKLTIDLTQTTGRTETEGQSRIYLNGSKVELPLSVDAFEISRHGPKVIALSEEGIGLHCNIINGLCSLDLSGWYHGKVAGIAGSLDKEEQNDFAQPDGRVVDSVVEFLEQWKVSSPGKCETPAKLRAKPKDSARSMCIQLFTKSDSPMQPCFSRLDPKPFKIMCEQDTLDGTNSEKGADCLAAEAYVEQCKFVGMEVSLPSYCSRCRLAGGRNIQAGDVVVYDSSPKSRTPAPPQIADFVFLIETGKNKNCLRGQHLLDLPAKIDTVLRATHGINSTKFALLTFGAGKPYSVHTLDGSIWSGRRGIQSALANLQTSKSGEDANNEDLYQALLAAASKLHFRPGASKNLILAPCTSCDRTDDTATVFSEASSLLLEADIRLHVLQRDEMMFKRTITKKTKQGKVNPVMGIDSHGAYTGRRVKGTSWPLASKAIMRQLSIRKDLCTPLTMETNGTLFSAARLSNRGASDDKRKWLDVWSRRVTSSAKPTPCQTCDCLPLPDGSSKLMCHPCVSPAIEMFLDEWERNLEEALQEDLEEESGSIEVPDLDVDATLSDFELEKEAINRVRGSVYPGNVFITDSV